MGRGFTQYSFPDSGSADTVALYSAFLDYRLPDGSLLHVRQRECWCQVCDSFLFAEDVPPLEALETELARLMIPDEELRQALAFLEVSIEERIEDTQQRIEWRRTRKSPPKCLHCGSTNITILPNLQESEEFRHPKTGERVVVAGRGFSDAAPWHAEFTAEGDSIRSDDSLPICPATGEAEAAV